MHYLIQENLFKETHFHILIELLDRHDMEYDIVRFIPFLNKIYKKDEDTEYQTDKKNVFVFGSTIMTKMSKNYDFDPGVIYNENHDMKVYLEKYGEYMLNHDAYIVPFDFIDEESTIPEYFFARPTKDLKIFAGQCFGRGKWNQYIQETIDNEVFNSIREKTEVLIAPLKTTQKEIRCWVVDGKVITISQYKIGSKVIQQNYDHEQEAIDFAQKMVDIYSPSKAFVLDICLFEGEYKIVEINCINCSGFYEANMSKLIQSLENTFS